MLAMPDLGIDWGMGTTNRDRQTGIRYGVISQHSLCPEAVNDSLEPDYGDPHCPECDGEVIAAEKVKHPELWEKHLGKYDCFDYACLACRRAWSSDRCYPEEAVSWGFSADGYEVQDCLDTDLMVTQSAYYTHAQFCSPCVPGAGNLDNPMEGGVRAYCFGHDWFEGGKAPYPVYRVSDDSEVLPDEEG